MDGKIFSRHVEKQYAWTQELIKAHNSLYFTAVKLKMSQQEYLNRRSEIKSYGNIKPTAKSSSFVSGYVRALGDLLIRQCIHVRRIIGAPETATSASWENMSDEMQNAVRNHNTESCLAWDSNGQFTFSEWIKE